MVSMGEAFVIGPKRCRAGIPKATEDAADDGDYQPDEIDQVSASTRLEQFMNALTE